MCLTRVVVRQPHLHEMRQNMSAINRRQTGSKAAKAAGKTLANPKSPKAAKTAAASALSQTPNRKRK